MLGTLRTAFRGRWVSDPEATRRAENKLVQLVAAKAAGFRVPRTLVSNDPAEMNQPRGGRMQQSFETTFLSGVTTRCVVLIGV